MTRADLYKDKPFRTKHGLKTFCYEYEYNGRTYMNYLYAESLEQARAQLSPNVKDLGEGSVQWLEQDNVAMEQEMKE
jgi:hypothetical protein